MGEIRPNTCEGVGITWSALRQRRFTESAVASGRAVSIVAGSILRRLSFATSTSFVSKLR